MEKIIWPFIQSWYDTYGLVHHQISSFDHFILHGLTTIIADTKLSFTTSKGDTVSLSFDNIHVPTPTIIEENRKVRPLTPQECREKNLTYSSPIFASVMQRKNDHEEIFFKLKIAEIPIMVRSVSCTLRSFSKEESVVHGYECCNDPGGYFIINGIDRVLVTQEMSIYNTVQVTSEKNTKYSYKAEIRSISSETSHSVLIQAFISHDGDEIVFNLPLIKGDICASIVFKACGIMTVSDAEKFLDYPYSNGIHQMLRHMFRNTVYLDTQRKCLEYIGSRGTKLEEKVDPVDYALQILELDLFPHLGLFSTTEERLGMLAYILRKLLLVYHGHLHPHNRDNLELKRFENSGILLYDLFKSLFRGFINDVHNEYETRYNIINILNKVSVTITKNILHCFATGDWGAQRNTYIRQGVSQVMNRLSYVGMLSHLRRVIIPVGREGKNFKIRQIYPSHFFFLDLFETPEGQSVGVVCNMALTTRISNGFPMMDFYTLLEQKMTFDSIGCVVFLNGTIIGCTETPKIFVARFKDLRRKRQFPMDVSISYDYTEYEIQIYCDHGRLLRPLLKMPVQITAGMTFTEAEEQGFVDWLDPSEISTTVLSMYPHEKGEYCEIHPSLMHGVCTGSIAFSDHSQAPRLVYEASFIKQALGVFSMAYQCRSDAAFHVLNYPQKSVVSTQTERLIGMHDAPGGVNCIVAIATYTGSNQEDAIIINKSAVERGLFHSMAFITYTIEEKKCKSSSLSTICVPPYDIQKKFWNYYHLDDNGFVRKGAIVDKNDVLVGRMQKVTTQEEGVNVEKFIDVSVTSEKAGIVDRVDIYRTPMGYRLVKVILRNLRIPELGDKLASKNSQKSTIGLILPQEDMPFTSEGIVTDLILNPLAIPSRMTISQLIETVVGKVCVLKGELGDGTPFSNSSKNVSERISKELQNQGYEGFGYETMYNGFTGKMLKAKIFIGPTYYQKLKHMISDKIHSRAKGDVTMLTRQPLAGRARYGGLKLGTMECEALIAQGISQFLREKTFDLSDTFHVLICNSCGNISNHKDECPSCFTKDLKLTKFPYASKLLFQQLQACGIKTKFHTQ